MAHLEALDEVYTKLISDNRDSFEDLEGDLVSQDLVVTATGELEKFQWFIRAHLENSGGQIPTR